MKKLSLKATRAMLDNTKWRWNNMDVVAHLDRRGFNLKHNVYVYGGLLIPKYQVYLWHEGSRSLKIVTFYHNLFGFNGQSEQILTKIDEE